MSRERTGHTGRTEGLQLPVAFARVVGVWLLLSAGLAVWIQQSLRIGAGSAPPWRQIFAGQLVVWGPWLLLAPMAFALGRRWVRRPGGPWRWTLRVLAILLVALGLNVLFISQELLIRGSWSLEATRRALIVNGALPILVQFFLFATLAGIGWGRHQSRLRARRQRLWDEARLAALMAKLRPHFLFNALNAVSALVERDPPAARRMLANLGDLMRSTLDRTDHREVPLREELAMLQKYLDIERVRYGDRLRYEEEILVPDEAPVPPLLLQPLVENAFHHGLARDRRAGLIRLRIEDVEGRMQITVEDDGPGPPPRPEFGIGLGSTQDRLHVLYCEEASLRLSRRPEGGARVRAVLPLDRPGTP